MVVSLFGVSIAGFAQQNNSNQNAKSNAQVLLGTVEVNTSGEGEICKTISTPVNNITGVHNVFFVFKGEKDLFNFDWWMFKK